MIKVTSMRLLVNQLMNNKLVEHKEYISEYGEDMPEVKNWKWKN